MQLKYDFNLNAYYFIYFYDVLWCPELLLPAARMEYMNNGIS